MKDLARTVVFVVAVLASAACAIFVMASLSNPHDDLRRGWTTLIAVAAGVTAVGSWTGFVLLKPERRNSR